LNLKIWWHFWLYFRFCCYNWYQHVRCLVKSFDW
jgi:hypothetical protein